MIVGLAEQRRVAVDERVAGRYAAAEAILPAAIEAASGEFEDSDVAVAVLRNDLAVTYKYAGRLDTDAHRTPTTRCPNIAGIVPRRRVQDRRIYA